MFKNPNYVYGPSGNLVPVKLNFGEFILEKIWSYKDKVCLINAITHEKLTYGEIAQTAMNFAVSLRHLGVKRGHIVAVCSENRQEFFGAVIGAVCAGAAVTAFNVGYTEGELKHVAGISKPKYLICSPSTYKAHAKTFQSLEFLKKIIIFGNERVPNVILYNDLIVPNNFSGSKLRENVHYEDFEPVDVQEQMDTLFVLYSSGTTGLPKGVMLTHLNVLCACALPTSHDPSVLFLTIAPWYHVMGLMMQVTALTTGTTVVYLPKFEVNLFLRSIERYKGLMTIQKIVSDHRDLFQVVQAAVVPPVLVAISKAVNNYDLNTVKFIFSGAAPLQKDTSKVVSTRFPNATVLQGYGMTEMALAVTRDSFDKVHLAKPGGVGYVAACNIVKIADLETRKPLGSNQRGEICVKGPLVMTGYMGQVTDDFDDEGFFKTGDIGYYDEDRCFFVVDRLKELIKYKGYQVPPAEIEATLLQHEGIKDAGVMGMEHATGGEVPLAFVVLQPGASLSEEEIKAFVAERLSNPKHLRGGVRFLDQIPKSISGKILRKELKKMAQRRRSKL